MSDLIRSLTEALRSNPEALPLRLHLAELLLADGQNERVIAELGTVLSKDPTNVQAQDLLRRALGARVPGSPVTELGPKAEVATTDAPSSVDTAAVPSLDWDRLEKEIGIDVAPPFVSDGTGARLQPSDADATSSSDSENGRESDHESDHEDPATDDRESAAASEAEYIVIKEGEDAKFFEEPTPERITLADVGGLEKVKERLRLAFLEPMRNPEIAKAYGKSLRGGLLLYGPPGTGKTYLARAIAGELDAKFLSITIADILDGVMGESEKNVRRIFTRARELAPCVLFIDELDSLGGKRSGYSNMGWMRNVVNQILQEMDGVGADNDGVFILAATNHPWDIDNALLRPGRFDRIVLVTAPDPAARAAILKYSLKDRPIAGIDLDELVSDTHGFSGADLTHVAATAAEHAMSDSIATGQLRPISMDDMRTALSEIKPSTGPWLQSARNVVDFANADGRYDELKDYLEAEKKYKQQKKQKK